MTTGSILGSKAQILCFLLSNSWPFNQKKRITEVDEEAIMDITERARFGLQSEDRSCQLSKDM